ncbi:DUF4147 domain-containing protein [Candidatus Woesearchaeota archaeon]|nr:DUF4147 domain-containing protein [Candidatus Woesearchaeota archaeon]
MVTIKNAKALGASPACKAVVKLLQAGLDALDPEKALKSAVTLGSDTLTLGAQQFSLRKIDRIIVVGAGKASGVMASVLEMILGDRISKGLIIDVTSRKLKRIKVLAGDHPVVSPHNARLTHEILKMTGNLSVSDLVICLFSGGGSALFSDPRINLNQYQNLMRRMLTSGATIQEFNTVRKHVDSVKGGRFAEHCFPANVVTLLVSDVPGNDPAFIASGPTVPDTTTAKDAQRILAKHGLPQVTVSETPKDSTLFRKVRNIIVLDNEKAVDAMKAEASRLRLKPVVLSTNVTGEARDVGKRLLAKLGKRTAVIAAGETTVTVRGKGKGGRNQELVLGSVEALSTMKNTCLASMGTDGRDNSDAAGAIADEKTLKKAARLKLDVGAALKDNDSYPVWKKLKQHIVTGPTGTNVSDMMVAVRS